MNLDERLELIGQRLDMLTKIHLDNDREYRERMDQMAAKAEAAAAAAEAQRKAAEARWKAADARMAASEARWAKKMNLALEKSDRRFDQRILKVVDQQERNTRDIRALAMVVHEDADNVRALARIADRHQKRLDRLDAR